MNLLFLALTLQDIPDAEATEAARNFERALQEADEETCDRIFDMESFLEAVTAGTKASEEYRKIFRSTWAKNSFPKQVMAMIAQGARYKFLRLQKDGGKVRALFRFLPPSGGVNYHEYMFVRKGGRVVLSDLYVYVSGETISETIRGFCRTAMADSDRKGGKKLTPEQSDFLEAAEILADIKKLRDEGEAAKALKRWDELPETLKKEKSACLIRVLCASESGDEATYARVIEEFEKAFPKDPALDLISFDGLWMKKKYDEVLVLLERLDRRVGGDPYLTFLRGSALMEKGSYAEALAQADRACADEPDLYDPHFLRISIALTEKKWADTATRIDEFEKKFFELGDLEEWPEFAEFVKSKEYADWKKRRKGK